MKSVLFVLSVAAIIYAGDPSRVELVKSVAVNPQSMPFQPYHVAGLLTMQAVHISELPFTNPASIALLKQPVVGVQFSLGSKIKDAILSDVDMQPVNQWLPTSAAFFNPVFGVPFALGFQKRYSEKIDFGDIPLTTVDQPDGTGETITADYTTEIYSYSVINGYAFNNLFSETDHLAIGIQFALDQISVVEKVWKNKATIDDFTFSVKAGMVYEFSDLASFGLLYEKNFKKEGSINYDYGPDLLYNNEPDSSGNNTRIYANTDYSSPYYFKFRDKISLGAVLNPVNHFNLYMGISYTFWDQVTDYLKNNPDFSISSTYFLKNGTGITLGVMSSNYSFKKSSYYSNNRDAIFLTTGIQLPLFQQTIHLQILDSHFFSDATRKQTILRAGFDYTFK